MLQDLFDEFPVGATFVILAILAFLGFGIGSYTAADTSREGCVVTDKDRTKDDMRVYTENCGTLVVSDNWFKGVTNASDLYAEIEPGQTYTFKTVGWRIPLFSEFPKVYAVN